LVNEKCPDLIKKVAASTDGKFENPQEQVEKFINSDLITFLVKDPKLVESFNSKITAGWSVYKLTKTTSKEEDVEDIKKTILDDIKKNPNKYSDLWDDIKKNPTKYPELPL
jgi:hypothetical protein